MNNGERRYRGGSRGRSPSPRRPPQRSRDVNPPRNWKLSPYRRRGAEEYPEEAKASRRIERRDYFDDRVSRFSEYDGRDRDRYEDGVARFRSPRRMEETVNYGNFSNYGDGVEGRYDNEFSAGGSRRLYNEGAYRDESSSMKLKWARPTGGIQKSDHLSSKDYGHARSSSGFGDIHVTSGDTDYVPQNQYLDPNRAGLPVSRYLDSTDPVPLKYENRGKIHSDSYMLARGGVSDLPVNNASGGDGSNHMSYVASEYLNSDASRKRYMPYGDEPHLERREGLNDRQDNYFEKKSSGSHVQDRNLGVGKTVESELHKIKKEDNLLSSRSYLKGDSDYMGSSSQHKGYNSVHSGISREGFSGHSPTRDLHLPLSDSIHRGSRLASQPIRFDGYSEKKQDMLLPETGGQLDDKRSSSHFRLPEDRRGDWSYAEFGRSKLDSLSRRVDGVEEDYRDQHVSRSNALKHTVDTSSQREHMEDDGLWNDYPPYQVQSTPDKFYVHGSSLHVRREDVDTLGSGSTRLDYRAGGYCGYGGVKTEQHYADMDGRQWSHFEDPDHMQSRDSDSRFGRIDDSPRKRLPIAGSSMVESYDRRLRDRLVRDEMYEDDIGIRISADGNGARRIYSQADMEDEIDLLHFPKKPKSSRVGYEKTWRGGLGSDEPSSSGFRPHRSFKPQKSNSRDIKKRLGPTQKLHVSQRLVKKYKPSIKKRLAPPPSKKHTLPWLKTASSSKITSEQNNPDGGIKDHGEGHLEVHLPRSKPEPPEKSEEFKQLVQSAYFKFLKQINETPMKRKKFLEQGKAGTLKCFVCGRSVF